MSAVRTDIVLGHEPAQWPLTIGVALPIPEPFLGELGAYRERFGDPLAHAIVAHITLVPPMEVADEEHLGGILAHLAGQAAALEPFTVVLGGAGTFRPVSDVVFVPLEQGEPQVRQAEAAVRRGPLDRELNFAYHPHVTVAHGLDERWLDQAYAAMQPYRAAFEVDRLGLFLQHPDGVWRLSVEFPFGEQAHRPERSVTGELTTEVVAAAQLPQLCGRLGEILAESVADGAGIDLLLPFTAEDGAAWWRARVPEVAAGARTVLVARDGDEVVGTVTLVPAKPPNQHLRAELCKLVVSAANRRRGVATRLMAAAETRARDHGFRLLTLDCVSGGPDEALYRNLGYHTIGMVPRYSLSPSGRPVDATLMYLPLG